jgi:hypothetical protein
MLKISESLIGFKETTVAPDKVQDLTQQILTAYRALRRGKDYTPPTDEGGGIVL